VALIEAVKPEEVKAMHEDGILEVVVPKAGELSAAKRIPITVGNERKALDTEGPRK
jgi:HSP20 family molecular chaperone IbpA